MKTLAAHGLAGGIVQDRMGGSFGAGFLSGSLGSYLGSSGYSKNMSEMIGMIQGKSRVNPIRNQHQNYHPFCLARYRLLIHERLRFS
jgi:hypothetical protein